LTGERWALRSYHNAGQSQIEAHIRYHPAMYASRTKGRRQQMPWVAERAPEGWTDSHRTVPISEELGYQPLSESEEEAEINAQKRAWGRGF